MKLIKSLPAQLAVRLLQLQFVSTAVIDKADLSAFKKKPSLLVIIGILTICLSFLMGWPAVAAIGVVSIKMDQPLIAIIGCPLSYGLSHLVFILGMYLSGGKYTIIFLRWMSRVSVEKLQAWS